ncbi:ATP-binding SpoIIE family protein phosphatase [Streptomyces acidicola]|uniref:ATP-binding SpoIIE family protein phosphatase n=1 Tax=Streptomyces acidicola TaxID=2596892 RepID=UPI0034338701
MAVGKAAPGSHAERSESARLGFVTASDDERWGAEALALALQQATTCLGGLGALVHRSAPNGHLRLVATSGLTPESTEAWADLHNQEDVAPTRAVRSGDFAWVVGDSLETGAAGTASVPLLGPDGQIGVLSVLTAAVGEPDGMQRSFLRSVAIWSAGQLEGVPGRPPGRGPTAGPERAVRMGELTAALAEAATSQEVVQAVAEHVLPPSGADGLAIQVLEGGRLHIVGSSGYPPEVLGPLHGLPLAANAVATDVLGTRTPQFVESRAEFLRRYPTMKSTAEVSPKNAWAFLPMIASGRAIGFCVVSYSRPRFFSDEERTLLTALSGLVGQSLGRARLYDLEHARAQELQRGLLPRTLPSLPAVRAAARYLPAGRGEHVGGDWYDLIPLSADRVALVIGDVMGHGIAEAATMGRLRTAVRTLAELEMPPAELFGRLNDLMSDLGEDFYATCLYAVFDPVTRSCTFSLAGHPPPVVVYPDGTVHMPALAADPPLGAAEPPFETHELYLPAESLVVLCTDGLVESAAQDIDQGLARLQGVLAEAAARTPYFRSERRDDDVPHLDDLCDRVVSALQPDRGHTSDDAALLIAHTRCTAAGDVVSFPLPEDPQAAGEARRHVREQLTAWGLDEFITTTELLASELVGNAIRHAKGPLRLLLLRSRSLICAVFDGSLSTPHIRHATYTDEGGRGLFLIATLSLRWGARYLDDGKCIWCEQDLPQGDASGETRGAVDAEQATLATPDA